MARALLSYVLLLHVSHSLATPLNPLSNRGSGPKNTGSSTLPYCLYNYGGSSQCQGGAPNMDLCEQATTAVCTSLSQLKKGDVSPYEIRVGSNKPDDCFAVAANTANADPLDFNACKQKFGGIAGCANPSNAGYNASCVGGSINMQFDTKYPGLSVTQSEPVFAMHAGGPGDGGGGLAVTPPGPSTDGTGEGHAINANSVAVSRAASFGGFLGTDPE